MKLEMTQYHLWDVFLHMSLSNVLDEVEVVWDSEEMFANFGRVHILPRLHTTLQRLSSGSQNGKAVCSLSRFFYIGNRSYS